MENKAVTREGSYALRSQRRNQLIDLGLQLVDVLKQLPLEIAFEMFPQSFNRIQFRTVSRLEQQHNVLRNLQVLGFVKQAIINLQHIEGVGITGSKLIEKPLVADGIDMRKL